MRKRNKHKGRTMTIFRDKKGIEVREGTLLFEILEDRDALRKAFDRRGSELTDLRDQLDALQKEIAIRDKLTMSQLETTISLQHLLILRTANSD